MFEIDPVLARDSVGLGLLDLCQIRLMNDMRYPWIILVPEIDNVREIHQLSAACRTVLIEEISLISTVLERLHGPDKINIGALGNIVSQLHIHVIARFKSDATWPGPVWGKGKPQAYSATALERAGMDVLDMIDAGRARFDQ